MTQEAINSKIIHSFPGQMKDWEKPINDAQLAFQTKIVLTKMLNKAALGQYILTEKDKADILYYNQIVTRCGYPPIDCDLSQF